MWPPPHRRLVKWTPRWPLAQTMRTTSLRAGRATATPRAPSYAGAPGSGPAWGGWRWTSLGIPAGATITEAYVELNQSGWGYNMTTTLAFEDSPNPATFSGASTPYDRWANHTTIEVDWAWPKKAPGTWIQTPSLVAIIQELVDTHGAIDTVVLLEDGTGVPTGRYHQWVAFEGGPSLAAKLHITYSSGA